MTPEHKNDDAVADYQARIEEHEFTKRQGIEAWAEAISDMLPKADPDKALMIREGLKALLSGPPNFPVPSIPFPTPSAFPQPVAPPEHIFEEHADDGSITVWDWMCLASHGTHSTLNPDKSVLIMKGDERVILLRGIAAETFWQWKTDFLNYVRQSSRPVAVALPYYGGRP